MRRTKKKSMGGRWNGGSTNDSSLSNSGNSEEDEDDDDNEEIDDESDNDDNGSSNSNIWRSAEANLGDTCAKMSALTPVPMKEKSMKKKLSHSYWLLDCHLKHVNEDVVDNVPPLLAINHHLLVSDQPQKKEPQTPKNMPLIQEMELKENFLKKVSCD